MNRLCEITHLLELELNLGTQLINLTCKLYLVAYKSLSWPCDIGTGLASTSLPSCLSVSQNLPGTCLEVSLILWFMCEYFYLMLSHSTCILGLKRAVNCSLWISWLLAAYGIPAAFLVQLSDSLDSPSVIVPCVNNIDHGKACFFLKIIACSVWKQLFTRKKYIYSGGKHTIRSTVL